ncbi:hypothetical protein M885DRAFT_571424 [Pelagophyceae sp. CCMP2097]|nr:hypothetical protein M885DRAFT_571424 [Pelagophyceae sp. CCMP2097]
MWRSRLALRCGALRVGGCAALDLVLERARIGSGLIESREAADHMQVAQDAAMQEAEDADRRIEKSVFHANSAFLFSYGALTVACDRRAATKSRRIEGSSGIHVDWAGALKSDGAGNVAAPGEPSFELDVTVEGSSSLGKGVLDLSQLESLASGRRGGAAVVAVAAAAAGAGGNVNGDAVIQQSARNAFLCRQEARHACQRRRKRYF